MLTRKELTSAWADVLLVGLVSQTFLKLYQDGVVPGKVALLSVACLTLAAAYGSSIIDTTIKDGIRLLVLLIWLWGVLQQRPGDLTIIFVAMVLSLLVQRLLRRFPAVEWLITIGLLLLALATVAQAARWLGR